MKRLTILAVMICFTASLTYAQKQYDEIDYPELNEFNKPDIETFTTDNGIKFFLVQDKELPLIDVSVQLRTGGVLVPNEKTGLASITGQVIRSGGTENIPADSLNTLLENKAASMETFIGFTSGGANMNVLKEDFDQLLPVFIDLLTNPALPEEKIELAKTQTKSGISRRNDNAQQIGVREFQQLIYGKNSVYARNTEYETVNNITREDIVEFHEEHFTGNNMMVGIVGDFETSAMKEKLQETFGTIPAGDNTSLDFPEVNYEPASSINFINKSDVNQSFILMGHLGGMRNNPDYAEVQVMNQVLSGGFSGRLMQIVRTEMGLAYSVFGQYGMNSFYPGMFYAGVSTKSSTTAEATKAVIEQIKRLRNEPITEQELQDTKDQILNSAVFEYDSYEQVLNQQMSYEYRGLPKNAFEQYIEGVKSTTIEDVHNVAQEYLNPDSLEILVVGNKEEIGDQLQQFGDVNEIDISIPQPQADKPKETQKGDPQKGKELLGKMADSIIEPGTEVNSLAVSGEVTLTQQGQTLPVTMVMDYPNNMEQTIETPGGTLKMTLKNGQGTMTMAGNERQLPSSSPQVQNMKNTLNRSIITIAKKAGDLDPQFMGAEEVDGTTYNKVNVNVSDKVISLYLSQDTHLPAIMEYQQFNPQQGGQVVIQDKYSDWTSGGGVTYPYTQKSFADENQVAEGKYTSHEVNASSE